MPLSAHDKRLYARHLLLPEVGHGGQSALCAAALALTGDAEVEPDGRSGEVEPDGRAAEVARDYLERAGCSVREGREAPEAPVPVRPVPVPSAERVERLAGDPALREPAAALAGAFAAVEAIKGVLGVGRPASLDEELTLHQEPVLP